MERILQTKKLAGESVRLFLWKTSYVEFLATLGMGDKKLN